MNKKYLIGFLALTALLVVFVWNKIKPQTQITTTYPPANIPETSAAGTFNPTVAEPMHPQVLVPAGTKTVVQALVGPLYSLRQKSLGSALYDQTKYMQ